ncbi:MAG: hypothetical protein JKY53_14740, partial [Flavobacteriales bacterium]|nr:hypothetical protein [Flavobacteriales bacterium]
MTKVIKHILLYENMKIFCETRVDDFLQSNDEKIKEKMDNENDDYVLNVNADTYVEFLSDQYTIEPMNLDFTKISVSEEEVDVPGNKLSSLTFADPYKTYKKQEVTFHVPYSGKHSEQLMRCEPNPHLMWTCDVYTEVRCICFEILNLNDSDPSYIKSQSDEILRCLKTQLAHQENQIDNYNNHLKSTIQKIFNQRREIISKRKNTIKSLGYPVKGQETDQLTYSMPLPKKRNKIKPIIQSESVSSEPTLDIGDYNEILNIINDVGKMIEKYPNSYKNNDEEKLRDALLVTLQPYLDASVTGETFNHIGKTDILLSFKKNNIFVAECKIWHGEKEFLDAIGQLLSYFTWRDSKTALIIFVKNKEITPVASTIETKTDSHSNFISFDGKNDESWLNFTFHLNG